MDTFQVIYLAVCAAFAMVEFHDIKDRHPDIPGSISETAIVLVILSWPVWLVPMVIYLKTRRK